MNPSRDHSEPTPGDPQVVVDAAMTGSMEDSGPYLADMFNKRLVSWPNKVTPSLQALRHPGQGQSQSG